MANSEPLSDLQQQFKDIVEPLINQITISDEPLHSLTSTRLQEVLMERDIDDILCLKDLYSESLNIQDKANKVKDILQDILYSDTKLTIIDELIKQLIEQSVIFELKSEKRKELTADFQRSFNGLVTKEEIKYTRENLKKTTKYQKVAAESQKAGSNRYKTKKKKRTDDKIQRTVDALQDISDVISDTKTELKSPDLIELMNKAAAFIEHAEKIKQKELNDGSVANKEKTKSENKESVSVTGK